MGSAITSAETQKDTFISRLKAHQAQIVDSTVQKVTTMEAVTQIEGYWQSDAQDLLFISNKAKIRLESVG